MKLSTYQQEEYTLAVRVINTHVHSQHKNDKNSRFNKFIREEGVSNFKFNRLYKYPCSSLTEKIMEEQRVMDTINNAMLLNSIRAYTPPEQKKSK